MTRLLTNEDVEQVLDMPTSLRTLEPAYLGLAGGSAVVRHQSQTYLPGPLPDSSYCLKTVEGGLESAGVMAIRITSDVLRGRQVEGRFRREKIPNAPGGKFLGLVLLFSTETGELLAIMPDGIIQRLRVGAASALAARCMARADARSLGLLGAGNQAEAQLRGLARVRPIETVRVWSPTPERRAEFARRMAAELGIAVEAVGTPEEAVRGADIAAAATNSGEPVLDAGWIEPGMHVSFIREMEASDEALARADVLAVHTRQGEILHYTPAGQEKLAELQRGRGYPWERLPDLADLLAGKAPSRTDAGQVTMFMNNFGIGIQFAALGACAWRACRERGLGQDIPSDWFLESLQP